MKKKVFVGYTENKISDILEWIPVDYHGKHYLLSTVESNGMANVYKRRLTMGKYSTCKKVRITIEEVK